MHRLVISSVMPAAVTAQAIEQFDAFIPETGELSGAQIIEIALRNAPEALLVTSRVQVNAAFIEALPKSVKVIATFSVGYDHIDCAAAAARGITVTNTPDVLTDATADLAMLLMLATSRRAREYHEIMQAGWGYRLGATDYLGTQLTRKLLGIVGMGRIGQAVARRATAFDMTIAYHNRSRLPQEAEGAATYYANLNDLLKASDIISLHAPGATGTAPMLDAAAFALIKPEAILINTARGSLVDEAVLIDALEAGRLRAAGLDVLPGEPAVNPRLLALKNVFLTPHIASATLETRTAMGQRALDNIEAAFAGRVPMDAV